MESCVIYNDLSPWYRVCSKEIFIPKGSYGYGESRYVFIKSVQYPHLPVPAVKVPRLEGGGIGPRMESFVICDGPIAMVPRLHQGNIYTKRKLWVLREQIYIQQVGAITPLTCAVRQNTPSRGRRYRDRKESRVNWEGPIAMVPCLHQGNIYTKRKLRVWRDQKCIPLIGVKTILTCAGHQSTPSRRTRYRAQNGKLRNL